MAFSKNISNSIAKRIVEEMERQVRHKYVFNPKADDVVWYDGRPYIVVEKVGLERLKIRGMGFRAWKTIPYWEAKWPEPGDLVKWRLGNGV